MSTVKILPLADKWLKDQYGYCKRNYSRTEVLSLLVKFQQHLLQQDIVMWGESPEPLPPDAEQKSWAEIGREAYLKGWCPNKP